MLAGRRHELPDARRAAPRIRHRIECALDHRQQRDLQRHAALLDLRRRCSTDSAGCARPCARRSRDAPHTSLLPFLDQRVVEVGHREAGADALPQVAVGRRQRHGDRARILDADRRLVDARRHYRVRKHRRVLHLRRWSPRCGRFGTQVDGGFGCVRRGADAAVVAAPGAEPGSVAQDANANATAAMAAALATAGVGSSIARNVPRW